MSVCTYVASDVPLNKSPILWPLSRGTTDIYTGKSYVAQIAPGLENMEPVLMYLLEQMAISEELEVWHIWQGIEYDPVIRSKEIPLGMLTVQDLTELIQADVLATTTQYEIPVQYRIVIVR